MECQGILGRAVEILEQTGPGLERAAQVTQLVDALEKGDELQVFQASMVLDKGSRDELIALLDLLEAALGKRLTRIKDRRRILKAVELVKQLRAAAQLNGNPGQLAGWLCARMFTEL